jgi:hypothetical protein
MQDGASVTLTPKSTAEVCRFEKCAMIALAMSRAPRHMMAMAKTHPFTFKIEPDLLRGCRFRWKVCGVGQTQLRSAHSYATRREAEVEADKAMSKFATTWPRGR